MKRSRILMLRYLAVIVLALVSAGSTVPAALGFAAGPGEVAGRRGGQVFLPLILTGEGTVGEGIAAADTRISPAGTTGDPASGAEGRNQVFPENLVSPQPARLLQQASALRATQDGAWTTHAVTTNADGASSVYVADVDGDGDLDILSASAGDNKIAWYENTNGDGSAWTARTITTDANGATSVYAADVDGDGDLDALSASADDAKIAWYENANGDASAWTAHTIVAGGLALRLPFDEAAGATTFADASGNGRNASCSSSWCPTAGVDGRHGKALQFDGQDDYVEVPHSAGLNPGTELTMAAWVKLASPNNDQKIIGKASMDSGYMLGVGGSQLYPEIWDSDGTRYSAPWGTIPSNTWTHLAVTWKSGGQLIGYINGTEVGSRNASSKPIGANGHGLDIGAWGGSFHVNGLIDDVQVYTRTLSAVAIQALYASGQPPRGGADGATAVYAADVDGDGDMDALSASADDDKIAWYENTNGDASAWTAHTITTDADGATSVYAADVDEDGDVDVLSASADDDKIAWYENGDTDGPGTGDGSAWTTHTIATDADGATSVYAADVDGDGRLDVLSASADDGKIAWYENANGDASAWTAHTIVAGGLALRLPFDEAAGATTFADASGHGRDGSCSSPNCPTAGVAGRLGQAVELDGTDDYVSAGSEIDLAGRSFSVAFWAKRSATGRWDIVIGQGTNSNNRGLHLGFRDNNKFTCAFYGNDLDTPVYTDTNWHHWACTYDAATNQRTIFRDGAQVAQDTAAADYQGSGDLGVGRSPWGTDYFKGAADEVQVYTRALSAAEIQGLYAGQPPLRGAAGAASVYAADVDGDGDLDVLSASEGDDPVVWYENTSGDGSTLRQAQDSAWTAHPVAFTFTLPADLALWLPFDEAAGATEFADASGNGRNGSCYGGHCPNAGVDGYLGKALEFDPGLDLSMADYVSISGIDLAGRSFSVAFWAKRSATTGRWDIVIGQGTYSNNRGLYLGFRENNKFTCGFGFYGNDLDTPVYTDTNWHHWACTYDAATNQRTIFRDGAQVAQDTAAADYQGFGDLWVGRSPMDNRFQGVADEVQVYPRALSAVEIQILYAGQPAGTAGAATSVYAADVDRDGDVDVLSAHADSDMIAWHENEDPDTQGGPVQYVRKTDSTNFQNNCADSANPCNAIGHAISKANPGDTIQIAPGTYTENLSVTKSVTLIPWEGTSGEVVIDGRELDPVIRVGSSDGVELDVTLRSLAIQNGRGDGGGLRVERPTRVTIETTEIRDNTAPAAGGGVYNSGTLTVTRSSIIYNTAATGNGGGLYNHGDGEVTLINSTLSSNSADSGGGIYNLSQNMEVQFTTIASNQGVSGGANVHNDANGVVELSASIIAAPQDTSNCSGEGLTSAGVGFNRISDLSCRLKNARSEDKENQVIELLPLANNGGPTRTHAPRPHETVVDIMPRQQCEQAFAPDPATDQRGNSRPSLGIREEGVFVPPEEYKCDAGAVELGAEARRVCGPPLLAGQDAEGNPDFGEFFARCQYATMADALQDAQKDDTIVVSGVVTETVTVDKSVTLRGPGQADITPGTHMGFLQAAVDTPDGSDPKPGSVISIAAARDVTIKNLNIRHGDADQGGGINNAGNLTLEGVTLYQNRANEGGAIYNTGTLAVINSTLTGNQASNGAGIYNAAGTVEVTQSTLAGQTGRTIHNAATNPVVVGSTVLSAPGSGDDQCSGPVTSNGYNLLSGGACFASPASTDITGDPALGALRDNGGPTLTRAMAAGSPAIDGAQSGVATDQRGRARPQGAGRDIGAIEYGPITLTVCEKCDADPEELRFTDLQEALDRAMAGDVIQIEAGAYTGNFTAYKDVTLRHAGIDVATLNRDQPVDVRAVLQASERTIREQRRVLTETQQSGLSGTVLTVQAYEYPAGAGAPVAASGDVTVTLENLTVRHGLSRQGGGIYNVGHLYIQRSTIAENAAVNELQADGATVNVPARGGAIYNAGYLKLERSTVSGNRSEHYGGALYSAGSEARPAEVRLDASTVAYNKAERLPAQHVLVIDNEILGTGQIKFIQPIAQVLSGDEILFQNKVPLDINLIVDGPGCNLTSITVPRVSMSPEPLICTASQDQPITIRSDQYSTLATTITVRALSFTPRAHAIYASDHSEVTLAHTIVVHDAGSGENCRLEGAASRIGSGGYNLVGDSSCNLTEPTDLRPATYPNFDARLGPRQDNNAIDFARNWISGYTYSHALKPGSSAIDRIPPDVCGAATLHTITAGNPNRTVQAGDSVQWMYSAKATVALGDGEADVNLVTVPAGGASREMQFTAPGDYPYRVYNDATRTQIGSGTITVQARTRAVDQHGTELPQRGSGGTYACDIGAYELTPWVVGQPLQRPPAAIGAQPPQWADDAGTDLGLSYHAWSSAMAQDYPLRPSPNDGDADLEPTEIIALKWETSPDPASPAPMTQYGVVEWPDDPQFHASGAPVNLAHDNVSDEYQVSSAQAFEGRAPADEAAGAILTTGVFKRTVLTDIAGDSYSVLQFVKGSQANATLKVQVVKTMDWNTPGVRDMRSDRTVCEIGREIRYRSFTDSAGMLPGHEDPEGRPGQILFGDAFDGVRQQIDLTRVQNTVDGLVPPAHVRESREGPIIPVLNTAPTTFANPDPVSGGHDLRVAWYRPDGRSVAWPVKTVGYRCDWPANLPEIVIASELGSEIGGQAVLNPGGFSDVTVYHQPDPDEPGYNPNDEHALLAPSNLGNPAPALYALRSDLATQPHALLKYRDPREDNLPKIQIYKVVLTRAAQPITNYTTDPGTITLRASTAAANLQSPISTPQSPASTLQSPTVRVGDGDLHPGHDVTVLVEVLSARNLRSATVKVSYDPAKLKPTRCATNRLDFVGGLYNLQVATDAPQQPFRTVHMRASLAAGTDAQYTWDFGDGTTRIAGDEVSHVYGATGTYTVRVTASNGVFPDVTAETTVEITDTPNLQSPIPNPQSTGCRIDTDGELTIEVKSRNKHGLSGNLLLTELTFEAAGDPPASDEETTLGLASITLVGPGYEELKYNITAGNPVFAPTPLRGLLDIQPCSQTGVADVRARPFWKDFKGALWARAAGDMKVLYFYPLQTGFYLEDNHARSLGLVDDDGNLLSPDDRVGQCVPWMDRLPTGTETHPDFPQTKVLPVAYHADWPDLPPLLSVGETVYERAKSGISGVANQLAVARIFDNLAPGAWDNSAQKIVIQGAEVQRSLVQLIDPVGELREEVGITINDNPALPEEIKTERRLFGGGLAIVGSGDNTLPFALRSRVGFDDINGELVFRGYYDGASPEYIKGDPLLLLNVMSLSDKTRLQSLCSGGGEEYPYDDTNCGKYKRAVEKLYHQTRNPRQVDLCRTADGRLYLDDPYPTPEENWGTRNAAISGACQPLSDGTETYRDGQPDHALLIGAQDANDDGVPEPYEGAGKGKALTAGNAAGTGYITLAYNNDPSLAGLPVSLQVIQVGCTKNYAGEDSTYRGNLLTIKSDNLFDEKLTLRHTGDFGGQPDNFEFEWYIAEVDETAVSPTQLPPSYPWRRWTRVEPGADAIGPEITIEGANPTTLSDNWLIMRYKGYPVCGNQYRWSAFAGDPSAKPSEVRAQFAPGWIKRVTSGLNPFDTRVDDFVSSPVNTAVDMIRQAGPRYEGPIAFSGDPENLNKIGLIEAYQTVLDRGRKLSIDSGINHQGANAALLNVTSRIADLYMLLGNDATMDALDPTVGLGTDSALVSRAPVIFSFMNQFRPDSFGLIDEELALLRGRDETLGGVAAAPTYNRLTWNFTNGEGEVAYVMNYNIQDFNQDGFINEADAAIMYPQGHGDAWGHQLTAVKKYYELLRHSNYTWVPRAEPIGVAGAPVAVDYYDERRFAIAAANKAQVGAEIVDLTYRKHYAEPEQQPYEDSHVDASDTCDTDETPGCNRRAWGVADWARRAGQGAYFDWVVANAILPPQDDRYTDVRKIDRTTVGEIGEIAHRYRTIQNTLDNADQGVNPLGLAPDAVLFDLDPARTKTSPNQEGLTHFEQVYERAIASLDNTLALFDYANQVKIAQRESQDERRDFVTTIIEQDQALINELIELFGYPYDADIGANGTYLEGYDGPDIYNYDLWDRTEMTDFQKRCDDNQQPQNCQADTVTHIIEYQPMKCLGFFVEKIDSSTVAADPKYICSDETPGMEPGRPEALEIEHRVGTGLDKGRGRFKPASWPESAARKAPGEIQNALQALYQARTEYEIAITAYQNHVEGMQDMAESIRDRHEVLKAQNRLLEDHQATMNEIDTLLLVAKEIEHGLDAAIEITENFGDAISECIPTVFGFSNSIGSPVKCTPEVVAATTGAILVGLDRAYQGVIDIGEFKQDILERELEIDLFQSEADFELRQMGREMADLVGTERELRLAVFLAKDQLNGAQGDYDQTLQRAFRKLAELIRLRQRWAGQVSGQRYNDMAYRIFQNDALQKYRQQFDLAQLYTFLTAAAYDYETNLAGNDPVAGGKFLRDIVELRTLGEVRQIPGVGLQPMAGAGGLADPLARMRDNFAVLKGQMGFNNPQFEANRFSLRQELLRLRDTSDAKWRQELQRYYTPSIYNNDDVARLAKRPYGEPSAQPGLVIPFAATITEGLNFFGRPLGAGDSAYDATQFSTKIASVGVWFEGYDTERLAQTPRVYLLPAGKDVIRPRDTSGRLRYWNITEQLLPVPYPIGQTEMEDPTWIALNDGLDGQLFAIKPYTRFRAYPYSEDFVADEMNTDTRLIGRSVWNTEWVLVIPGSTLLADQQVGLDRFIEDVDDIYIYFQTYAYAGN